MYLISFLSGLALAGVIAFIVGYVLGRKRGESMLAGIVVKLLTTHNYERVMRLCRTRAKKDLL